MRICTTVPDFLFFPIIPIAEHGTCPQGGAPDFDAHGKVQINLRVAEAPEREDSRYCHI